MPKATKKKKASKAVKKTTPKKPKKKPDSNSNKKNVNTKKGNLVLQAEYLEFIRFIALPRTIRQEEMGVANQGEFAKKFGMDEGTLSDWKNREGFWDDVANVRKSFFRNRTGDVLLALETKNLDPRKANGADVKVLLTYTGEYEEKQQHEHTITKEVAEALERARKFLN